MLVGRGAEEISLLSGGLPGIYSDGAMPLAQKLDVLAALIAIGWALCGACNYGVTLAYFQ